MTATRGRPALSRSRPPEPGTVLPPRAGAWWLHPAWTALMAAVPGLLIAWALPDDTFRRWWRTPKHLDTGEVLLAALLLCCLVAGTLLAGQCLRGQGSGERRGVAVSAAQRVVLLRAGMACFALTVAGYAAWAVIALGRGLTPGEVLRVLDPRGGDTAFGLRTVLEPVAGVTTLTQLAPLAVVCLLLHGRLEGRRHTVPLAVIGVLVVVRTVLAAERLCLVEVVVPAVVLAAVLAPRRGRTRTWPWALAPVAAPLALVGLFATFEYARSWTSFYREQGQTGYLEFVLQRLAGYYATAYNNSAIVLTYVAPDVTFPHFTVGFLWNLPVVSTLWPARDLFGFEPGPWVEDALTRHGNPEFTNLGGVLGAVGDYGVAGGALWWLLVGALLGLCYRWTRRGELRGLVLYAIVYAGLVDIARLFYWGEGRAFPALVGAVVVAVLAHRARETS